jgi:hypothetical protein
LGISLENLHILALFVAMSANPNQMEKSDKV